MPNSEVILNETNNKTSQGWLKQYLSKQNKTKTLQEQRVQKGTLNIFLA